jgi:hypothetical protein
MHTLDQNYVIRKEGFSGLKVAMSMNRKKIEEELATMDKELSDLKSIDKPENAAKVKEIEGSMEENRKKLKMIVNKILVGIEDYGKQHDNDEEEEKEISVDGDVNMEGGIMEGGQGRGKKKKKKKRLKTFDYVKAGV